VSVATAAGSVLGIQYLQLLTGIIAGGVMYIPEGVDREGFDSCTLLQSVWLNIID